MDKNVVSFCPFTTAVLDPTDDTTDGLPAAYHCHEVGARNRKRRNVADPTKSLPLFLDTELSLEGLESMLPHLWFAGARHPATQLHLQVAMGRTITATDRMGLHLLWENDGKIFVKPIPQFLLDPEFWRANLAYSDADAVEERQKKHSLRSIALGFLYTYACLVVSESDFFVANKMRLLPRKADDTTMPWAKWKALVRELLAGHDPKNIHPRFQRAELRLSRVDTIHYFTCVPRFEPYLRRWRNYTGFFRDNLSWMAVATIYIALVLNAMQVGLATGQLQSDALFQQASYGFAIFAIIAPMGVLVLVAVRALLYVLYDLPFLLLDALGGKHRGSRTEV